MLKKKIIASLLTILIILTLPGMVAGEPSELNKSPWLKKPVLDYLLWTSDPKLEADVIDFKETLILSEDEFNRIKQIAKDEMDTLNKIYKDSNNLNMNATDDQKHANAQKFNHEVKQVLKNTDQEINKILGSRKGQFTQWIADWWQGEGAYRKSKQKSEHEGFTIMADMSPINVLATQYDAYTTYEVALPDKKIKFANLGWPGGYSNPPYTVDLYRKAVGEPAYWVYDVKVGEVGPWNEDDNYWDSADGSNPRRLFTDIGLGMNESYMAYVYDYNNGKDQFGRTVTNSAGIDLSPAIAQQLGLGTYENGWVNIYVNRLP